MLRLFRFIYIVRWYTWVFVAVFAAYVWSLAAGVHFPYDDNESKEVYTGKNSHQYHK